MFATRTDGNCVPAPVSCPVFPGPTSGGGNEKPGAVVLPPPGAVATFAVSGLGELAERLAAAAEHGPAAAGLALGWPARLEAGETIGEEGAWAGGWSRGMGRVLQMGSCGMQ